jgi:hypothetical protein
MRSSSSSSASVARSISWRSDPAATQTAAILTRLTPILERVEPWAMVVVVLAAHPRIRALLDQCRLSADGALHIIPGSSPRQ